LTALAYVEEVRGEYDEGSRPSLAALATLRTADRASTNPDQRIWLSTSIVRVLVKEGKYEMARAVADSLLEANRNPTPSVARYLAGVAALIGEVDRTEQLLVRMASDPRAQPAVPVPHAVAVAAARLTAYASSGVCSPSLSTMVDSVEQQVERNVAPLRRDVVRMHVLGRPLSLAVPCLGPSIVQRVPGPASRLVRMQRALGRGDRVAVRAHFDTLTQMRRVDRVGDIALDNTFQEAWLLLAMGDTALAQRHLCVPLSALPTLGSRVLLDAPQAAAIGRSLAVCARIAAGRNDRVAAHRWAEAVELLWATADSSLAATIADLRPLAATTR
jgi:hypothetical protein